MGYDQNHIILGERFPEARKGTARRRAGEASSPLGCFISDLGNSLPITTVLTRSKLRRHTESYVHEGAAKSACFDICSPI
jgi:hypothetical protein